MPTLAPLLETPRLRLRMHTADDWEPMTALWTHPETVRHIGGGVIGSRHDVWFRILRHIGHWAAIGYGYWAIEDRASGAFVGSAGLGDYRREMDPPFHGEPEAGWTIHPEHKGKGYATEAMQAVFAWAEAQGLPPAFCIIDPENHPSLRVAEKLGFRPAGTAVLRANTVQVLRR